MERLQDGSDVTGFGSFDNSMCKRDLLEPDDLRLGQVVIKRVAVVKLGVNNGSGDGGSWWKLDLEHCEGEGVEVSRKEGLKKLTVICIKVVV